MPKRDTFQDLALAPPKEGDPLWHWLYNQLRGVILNGRLKPGTRMPSTRNLASQYGLSRGTVVAAFDHLQSEGYLESQVGSGSFVAGNLPSEGVKMPTAGQPLRGAISRAGLGMHGKAMTQGAAVLPASHSLGKAFRAA